MSRSIREPYIVDSLWKKEKKFATKRVRRSSDVHNWVLEVVLQSGSSIELFYDTQEEAQKDALSIVERKKSYEEICNVRRHS